MGSQGNQICPPSGHASPWFTQIPVSRATSACAYVRVKNGMQANICNGTKNNLGFSLYTTYTQGIVEHMPMSVTAKVCKTSARELRPET